MKLHGALTMALIYDNYYARLMGQPVETLPEQPDIGCYAYFSKQLKRYVAVWYRPAAAGSAEPIECLYDGNLIPKYDPDKTKVAWAPLWVWAAPHPIRSDHYEFLLANKHLPGGHAAAAANRRYMAPTLVVDNTPLAPVEPDPPEPPPLAAA
jgi:hypothetical protein